MWMRNAEQRHRRWPPAKPADDVHVQALAFDCLLRRIGGIGTGHPTGGVHEQPFHFRSEFQKPASYVLKRRDLAGTLVT